MGLIFRSKPEGKVMVVDFRLNQMNFMAPNGCPQFKFNESIYIVINCDTQEE
jgi:predicted 3-demethylubiquinone-9 3-methyltransferase (glyoxalase superfamily)